MIVTCEALADIGELAGGAGGPAAPYFWGKVSYSGIKSEIRFSIGKNRYFSGREWFSPPKNFDPVRTHNGMVNSEKFFRRGA